MTNVRPIYENSKTADAEQQVIDLIAKRWKCIPVKMPRHYQFDYGLTSFRGLAIAEVKCRTQKYETLIIAMSKIHTMLSYSQRFKVPAFLIIQWPNELAYVKLTDELIESCTIEPGGRTDRNDPADTELVVHIPVGRFTEIQP